MAKFTDPATVRALVRYYDALSGQVSRIHDSVCIVMYYKDWLTRGVSEEGFYKLLDNQAFIRLLVEEELSDG